jgi:anti-sigma B factor antagonist
MATGTGEFRGRRRLDQGDSVILSKPMTSSTPQDRDADGSPAATPGANQPKDGVPVQAAPVDHQRDTAIAQTLRLSVERPESGVVVVRMSGEIDLASVPRLTELISQRLTAVALRTMVLDLSEVEFLSSSGLELLLHAQRRAEHRGVTMYLIPGGRCVHRLLDLTDTTNRFCLRTSVAEAIVTAH